MKRIICILSFLSFIAAVFASSHFSAQPHQQLITSITPFFSRENPETAFLSTGDDGFLVKWTDDDQDVGIKLAACSPNGNYVAIYETDGGSINKISVWDWKTLTRKYQKKFSDSITSLSFSKKGTYLIAGTATVDGVIFIRTSNWTVVDKIKLCIHRQEHCLIIICRQDSLKKNFQLFRDLQIQLCFMIIFFLQELRITIFM